MRNSVATGRLPAWARWVAKIAVSPDARADALYEWRRRWRGEPGLPPGEIRNLLVICQGNVCRSAFAEGLLIRRGLTVRSAGLAARDGKPADAAAVRAAHRVGIDLTQHTTSKLRDSQVEWADLILCMEGWQAKSVAAQWPSVRHKIRLVGDFLSGPPFGIADPWDQSDEVFAATFERLAAGTERIAQLLGRQKN